MSHFFPAQARRLAAFLLLCALPVETAQAGSVNLCSSNGSYSIAQAQEYIFEGDAFLNQAPDCLNSNWNTCLSAEIAYLNAANHLNYVMAASTGNNCLTCDPTSTGNFALMLVERQNILSNMGYAASFAAVYNEYRNWKDEPYCSAVGGNQLPTVPAPLPLPAPPVQVPAPVQECGILTPYKGISLVEDNAFLVLNPSFEDCERTCRENSWCQGFSHIWRQNICLLHSVSIDNAVHDISDRDAVHYDCSGRY